MTRTTQQTACTRYISTISVYERDGIHIGDTSRGSLLLPTRSNLSYHIRTLPEE